MIQSPAPSPMTSKQENKECCEKCGKITQPAEPERGRYQAYMQCVNTVCPCHQQNKASWREEYNYRFHGIKKFTANGKVAEEKVYNQLEDFISKVEQEAYLYGRDVGYTADTKKAVAEAIERTREERVEHCAEPECPECNIAAYKVGQLEATERVLKEIEKYIGHDSVLQTHHLKIFLASLSQLKGEKDIWTNAPVR